MIWSILSKISFEIGFESSFNWHFWFKIVVEIWILATKLISADEKRSKSLKSIDFNRKWSNLIENIKNPVVFDHFWLNNRHHDNHFWSFNQKLIEQDQNWLTLIKNRSKLDKIAIVDSKLPLKSESDQNRPAWFDSGPLIALA